MSAPKYLWHRFRGLHRDVAAEARVNILGRGGKENQFPKAKQALPVPCPLVTL